MSLPEFSLQNPKIIYFFLAILLIGGVISFDSLGKKEDAPFVIKQAVITISYPGATPLEVEELITEPIEREIQSMSGVYKINSDSYFSHAKITVELDPATPAEEIPQKWDELRRKTLNIQSSLPQGTSTIKVSDDFGDVFGIYYALCASEGFTLEEQRLWAERIKKELSTIEGVKKVALYGTQREVINISISTSTLTNIGIDPSGVSQILQEQNQMIAGGIKEAGALNLTLNTEGVYKSIEDIKAQVITTKNGSQIRLGDIATISKDYYRPASTLMFVDGLPAIAIGISTLEDRDVVKTGALVSQKLDELLSQIPIGLAVTPLYLENTIAHEANTGFILNLIESLLIVVIVILIVMGWRSGVLIGSSLLFSIGGTMLLMLFISTGLNRTSLAGFIIAMGMLVDNAIVVSDNAKKNIRGGMSRSDALTRGATTPQWALLGATIIGICSFLPLYLAPSATAEIVKPLFIVLALSLSLSWVLALSQTPLFGSFILRQGSGKDSDTEHSYSNKFYKGFSSLLRGLIRWRWLTLSSVVVLLIISLWVMSLSPKSFFPSMDKPYFRADCILPDGYSIYATQESMNEFAEWIKSQKEVKRVSMTVGSSPLRYYLASTSLGPKSNVGTLLVELFDSSESAAVERRAAIWAKENLPDMLVRSSLFKLSPAVEATIEIGFLGQNIDTLQKLTLEAREIMQQCALVGDVRGSWGNKVNILKPIYSQIKGQRLAISRHSVALYSSLATSGITIGELREGDSQIPILLKDNKIDDFNLANFASTPILSPQNISVTTQQVLDTLETLQEWSVIRRYNRTRVSKAQCDPLIGANTAEAFSEVLQKVNASMAERIPEGYTMKIFGEEENQAESNAALAKNVPLTFIIIFIILLLLFRNYSSPLIILSMLPLILIGVISGLALSGKTLDFFAILGLLGLIGMNIKNAVVLLEEINHNIKGQNTPALEGVLKATTSRIVPVVMASGTTILGMLPLLPDALFGGMAATIMGGLFFSTLLTILILPVAYCTVKRIK
ncbi:MAG: efflux RND transporter permease subunit [Rikenellaceae bacterium]